MYATLFTALKTIGILWYID